MLKRLAALIVVLSSISMPALAALHILGEDPQQTECATPHASGYLASCLDHQCTATNPTE